METIVKFSIKHEIKGRIRVHMLQSRMTVKEADTLLYYLYQIPTVDQAKVYERTGDAVLCFSGDRRTVLEALKKFSYDSVQVPSQALENSGRELNLSLIHI